MNFLGRQYAYALVFDTVHNSMGGSSGSAWSSPMFYVDSRWPAILPAPEGPASNPPRQAGGNDFINTICRWSRAKNRERPMKLTHFSGGRDRRKPHYVLGLPRWPP
jgi:hypothetical protein